MSAKKAEEVYIATGRRKTSTARVRITPGTGLFLINGREANDYCPTEQLLKTVNSPLEDVDMADKVDVTVNVRGGGCIGQASAIRLGISRALEKYDEELRSPLKRGGFLRRDSRVRERKKSGRPGARKRFQFSKR